MTSTLDYGIAPPGYRLPEATRLGRVRLRVASLERSLPFYEQVLGFRTLHRDGDVAVLGAHGDDRPLVELHARERVRPVPRSGLLGLYHFAVLLPDRAALGRFLAHLGALGVRAGMSDHLVSEAIYLQDPDNLGIEVYADRPRSAWEHRERELTMTTVPLDARSVVSAAGGMPWTGMPSGTTIGHVHLHVGDVDRASRFYHEGLGFDRVVWSYPGALFLSAGGYHHHLGTNIWAAHAPPAGADDAGLIDWEILVPSGADVAAAAASLREQGTSVVTATSAAEAEDPWGTRVRVAVG